MQKRLSIIIVLAIVCCPRPAFSSSLLEKGDSLFAAKQYTQAFDYYSGIFKGGQYSPAMLLKMAYIEEALNRLGGSMYYLNLYYLATRDPQALKKMEELAEKNNLKGYENGETRRAVAWLEENHAILSVSVASLNLFLIIVLYVRLSRKRPAAFAGTLFLMTVTTLFVMVNFGGATERGIVTQPQTYLMSGPSAGASVIAIIGEGHQLVIDGKHDVWLKVQWNDREAYVRGNLIQPVKL